MSEDDSNLGLKVHEDAYRELERERDEWKAKYIQQNKALGCEMMDPAGTIWDYASGLQRENVQLKREVERERALANEAIATWKKTREERDEAREQRDRLAEALERILSYQGRFSQEDPESIAAEALQSLTPNEL
jgi:predicted  nucleic acid-binding Zn-ribbon protein